MPNVAIKESGLYLRNAYTRLPFRYGNTCLEACPQAVLRVVAEVDGRRSIGHSADALPPGWFDKRPKPYETQIQEQLAAIDFAGSAFADAFREPAPFFPAWLAIQPQAETFAEENDLPPLLTSFATSLYERALLDAIARAHESSFHNAMRENRFAIDAGAVHPALAGQEPAYWLPESPRSSIAIRHTIGLIDPMTDADIPDNEKLNDGLPQSFEEYVETCGLRHFKIKVSNRLDHDLDRLETIARIVEAHCGDDYLVTVDGNEQYNDISELAELYDAIAARQALSTLWKNTLIVEQPLNRAVALDGSKCAGLPELNARKAIIIDESDATLTSYADARALGYGGVSSKACKGPIKSVLNAGLAAHYNASSDGSRAIVTGEDLTCVGLISLQTDLCLVASLGLTHVEKNGHHYYRGLEYIPEPEQVRILGAHSDLYDYREGYVAVHVENGEVNIASLQCSGFGFAIAPDLGSYTPAENWQFSSLGLASQEKTQP